MEPPKQILSKEGSMSFTLIWETDKVKGLGFKGLGLQNSLAGALDRVDESLVATSCTLH